MSLSSIEKEHDLSELLDDLSNIEEVNDLPEVQEWQHST